LVKILLRVKKNWFQEWIRGSEPGAWILVSIRDRERK
jgi:hypothetical protein